jgi:signal transduction histidine kinase
MAGLSGVIREEVKRLDGLVGDFLLFSRADRIQYHEADLEQIIDEVVHLLRPEARAGGVTIRRQRAGEPIPPARMDGEKMKQVVINLLRNAVEAMPEGGVVTLESGLVDGRARLGVRDTGPGLPPGLDVFQLFVTTKPKGTGLGLSIVQQIVLQHGGDIVASAGPAGEGACFTVTLPLPRATDTHTEEGS